MADEAPRISVAAGITVGLVASFIQSLGLTIQRKSHLQNDSLPVSSRRSDWHRPLWLVGFTIYFTSNILGSIFQIGALPLVILGPLGAVSLLWNAILARFLLGDLFSYHLLIGTVLIAGGAVLIGYFGVVPEPAHPLDDLIKLYSRPAFIIEFVVLCVAIAVVCAAAHTSEWRLEKRLRQEFLDEQDEAYAKAEDGSFGGAGGSAAGHPDGVGFKAGRRRSTGRIMRPRALSLPTPGEASSPPFRTLDASVPQTAIPSISSNGQDTLFSPTSAVTPSGPPTAFVAPTVAVPTPVAPSMEKPLRPYPSASSVARIRLVLGVAYGSASGTLSGICLLFAKTGVELLILTVVGVENEFVKWQTWVIVGALVAAAVLQLWYLNKALRLVGPTLICPLAFCFYNLSGILNGLVYYDQVKLLSGLQIGLVVLGTAVLLTGVWVVSIRAGSPGPSSQVDDEDDSATVVDEEAADHAATETTPLIGSTSSRVAFNDEPTSIDYHDGSVGEDDEEDDEEWSDEERERRRKNDFKRTIEQVYRMFVDEEHSGVRGLSIGLGAASPGFAIRPRSRRHTLNPRLSLSSRHSPRDSPAKSLSLSSRLPLSDSLPSLPPTSPPSSPEVTRAQQAVMSPRSKFRKISLGVSGRTVSAPAPEADLAPQPTVSSVGMTSSVSSEGPRIQHRRRSSRRHAARMSISGDPYVGVGDEANRPEWVFEEATAPLVRERPHEESLLVRAGTLEPEHQDEGEADGEGSSRAGRLGKGLRRWLGWSSKGKGVKIHNSQASIVIEDFVEDFVQRADRSHEVASRAEARRDVLDKALLLSLGLNGPMIAKPQTPVRAKKTKARPSLAASVSPSQESVSSTGPTRRSARFQKKDDDAAYEEEEEEDDFTEEEEEEEEDRPRASRKRSAPRPSTWSAASAAAAAKRRRAALPGGVARKVQSLVYNGRPNTKIFGHQVGTEVGDTWDSRMLCSQAGVHGPPVGGIHGHQTEGCWSVALSGGYEDDVDLGYGFTYTGSGGRDLKGTKNDPKNLRSAPQSFDQEFTGFNLSLKVSVETRNPVRVIRGFKNHSCFAPETGYRYDGLYTVEKAWSEVGQAGHLVCRFAFVRLPGQPKIPVQEDRAAEAEALYRDMGFDVDSLPASPVKTKWTRKLAQERVRGTEVDVEDVESDEKVNVEGDADSACTNEE